MFVEIIKMRAYYFSKLLRLLYECTNGEIAGTCECPSNGVDRFGDLCVSGVLDAVNRYREAESITLGRCVIYCDVFAILGDAVRDSKKPGGYVNKYTVEPGSDAMLVVDRDRHVETIREMTDDHDSAGHDMRSG